MDSVEAIQAQVAGAKALSTPAGVEVIAKTNEFLTAPHTAPMCEVLGQPFHGWTIGQLWELSELLTLLFEGNIRLFSIPVKTEPVRDKYRGVNQAKLRAGLPEKCVVEVFGAELEVSQSVNDCDGVVAFPEGFTCESWQPHPDRIGPIEIDLGTYNRLPLEIGHTDASTTLRHLRDSGGVARWPYGHDLLGVLVEVPRWQKAMKIATYIDKQVRNARKKTQSTVTNAEPQEHVECQDTVPG